MTTALRPTVHHAPFLTTRWTRVCLAKANSDDGRRALADLCEAYYEPVVAYLRRALGESDAARDMGHAFFAEILAGGAIDAADPERGRFRCYLLGAVKHFVAHQREAAGRLRRGGGTTTVSLDADSSGSPTLNVAADERLSPEAAFDRQWAVTVLGRAMDALQAECAAEQKSALFEKLRPWLLGESAHGDQAAVAQALDLTPGAMKVAVHRLRRRFRRLVKAEIAATLRDPSFVDQEMRALFIALGG